MKLSQSDYVALYLPKTARKITHKHSDAVAYAFNDVTGKPCACVFFGKQSKPIWRYRFANEEAREKRVTDAFKARAEFEARKLAAREARKAWQHDFEPGDLFRSSWGYDQTNIDYYEVVGTTAKTLTVRKIARETTPEMGFMTAKCSPLPGQYVSESFKVIPRQTFKSGPKNGCFSASSCSTAFYFEPEIIAGVKVYGSDSYSWYA